MKRNRMQWCSSVCVVLGLFAMPAAAQDRAEEPAAGALVAAAPGWIRKQEDAGGVLHLQMAVREFAHPDPARPRVTVAGAVHIGEAEFYNELQEILDAHDVVLFEGVKSRMPEGGPELDRANITLTRSRMRIISLMLEAYRRERGEYPEAIAGVLELWPDAAQAKQPHDAWGNELVYLRDDGDRYELVSLGADGVEGGEGAAAEIRMGSDHVEEQASEARRPEGIQKQMADAMGLVFQLEAMNHSGPNWRNSDMAIEDLRDRLKESGVQADGLFSMLDGSSMMGRLSGMLLGMMGSNPQSRAMLKVMLIELLADAEKMFDQLPGQMGAMMSVIVKDRNEVVLKDLETLIEHEPEVRTVGIIYGAGHLAHLQERLTADLGYEVEQERWLTAMEVDPEAAGITEAQLRTMRQMIQRSVEAQSRRRR